MKLHYGKMLFLCMISQFVQTAGPVVHVYIAQHWLKKHGIQYTDEQKKAFIVGTLFPDIRYLDATTREKTHEHNVTTDAIKNCPDAFEAGKKLHSLVDVMREQALKKTNTYEKLTRASITQNQATFLKLLEDEMIYDQTDVKFAQNALNLIPKNIQQYGVTTDDAARWHSMLKWYLWVRPRNVITIYAWLNKNFLNIPASRIQEWYKVFDQLGNQDNIKQDILKMIKSISDYLED